MPDTSAGDIRRASRSAGIIHRSATSHAPCVYSLEYRGAAEVTISPHPSPSGVSARATITSRTVSVPNDVVKGATSGRWSTRSSTPSRVIGALSMRPG